jgi:hypothetical protein
MDTKKPFFMPAPRPASRVSADDAKRLIEGSADLGFSRASSPAEGPIEDVKPQALARSSTVAEKENAPAATRGRGGRTSKPEGDPAPLVFTQSVKVDVSDEVWTALKMASIHRRSSVKFLVLEALSKAGYPVDLSNIPEDGRRIR